MMETPLQVKTSVDIANLRKPYKKPNEFFDISQLVSHEPMGQFRKWFEDAVPHVDEPNCFCLATASKDGVPSTRFLLLKGFDETGFKFFTNYDSLKGKDLEENPIASICFYWSPVSRSVRVDGCVEKLPEAESAEYFHSRPKDSQISASVSNQSEIVPDRQYLLDKRQKYIDSGEPIPKPERWGGVRLIPHTMEFYQGQTNRLSDRIRFRKITSDFHKNASIDPAVTHQGTHGWVFERLAP